MLSNIMKRINEYRSSTDASNNIPDVATDVYSTTQGCTKLCVTPLSNMHDTSTPRQVAFSSNKFGHSDESRLDIRAITGDVL